MNRLILMCGLMFLSISTWAQTRAVTGTIKGNQADSILIGATIAEKGTPNVVESDESGNFSIMVSDTGKVVLIVTYSTGGYKTKEIEVGSQSNVTVQMEDDVQQMEEVVFIGYSTVRKSDLTGAVASLKPDDVKQVPSGNVMESIQGKATGVDVTTTSGEAGKSPNITVRGTRSISAGNNPLYIVDGVQYSSIQDINPEDIQNMEVLKDASSTAIYGSRGSNGVVIITTKKGAAGATKVTVSSYMGVSTPAAFPSPMNRDEYVQYLREIDRTAHGDTVRPDDKALSQAIRDKYATGKQTDYIKDLLRNGTQKDLTVGISGGSDKIKTYFSVGYFNQTGLLKNDNIDRYTGRLNIDYQLNKFLKVGSQTQVTYYNQNKRVNPIGNAAKINPMSTPYDDNGNLITIPFSEIGGKTANPLLDEQPNTATDRINTLRIFPTLFAEATIIKGLTARTNMAFNFDNKSEGIFNSASSFKVLNGSLGAAQASHEATYQSQLNWQGIINYTKKVGKDLNVTATLLSEVLKNKSEGFYEIAYGQLVPDQSYYNFGDNTTRTMSSAYRQKALVSFAGRLNLSYKDKYLLTVTGREDGASVLADGHKWDFFPSVAGAWRISDEKFLENQKIFNTIKLRASWGVSGNSNIGPYSTQSNLIKIPATLDDATSTAYVYKPQIGNTDTKWEKSRTLDYGVDLGILKDRITVAFDYYATVTNDLLLTQKLPSTTGVSQTVSNVGKTQNRGVELSLTSVNVRTKKFKWSSTITFMKNQEKVLNLTDGLKTMQITTADEDGTNQMTKTVSVGYPVNSFYDYEKVGIWQINEADEAAKYGQKPGMIHIKDQNGDGKITTDDRVVVGSSVPKFSGGFSSEFKYKNFDLTLYFFTRVGQTFYYNYTYSPTNNGENNLGTREYWTPENGSNDLPRPGYSVPSEYTKTFNYRDGSFFKLRNITIGYSLPKALIDKMKISRLRFYITGKNLLIFNKEKNYDTEMDGSLTFPTVKLYVVGVNMDF